MHAEDSPVGIKDVDVTQECQRFSFKVVNSKSMHAGIKDIKNAKSKSMHASGGAVCCGALRTAGVPPTQHVELPTAQAAGAA